MKQPCTRREGVVDEVGGRRVPDPYRWLEPDDSAECARWLAAQQRWLQEQAGAWQGAREVFGGLLGRFVDAGSAVAPVSSPPVWRAGRRFFLQRAAGQERPVLMARDAQEGPAGGPRSAADRPERAHGVVGVAAVVDGPAVACHLVVGASEAPLLQVVDVSAGRSVGPVLRPGRMTAVAWLPGDRGLFYVTCPADGGPRQVRLHAPAPLCSALVSV
jgi:prolyl oligopeptidase